MHAEQDTDRLFALWHQQSEESAEINVEDTPMPVEKFQRAIRRRNVGEYVAAAIVVVLFGMTALDDASTPVTRIGSGLCVVGTLYVAWQLYRRASSTRPAPGALADTCLAFHRKELERQRDALASVWRWYLAPLVPGLIVMLVGVPLEAGRDWTTATGPLGVGVLLFVGIGMLNHRAARSLQAEIEALDEAAKPR